MRWKQVSILTRCVTGLGELALHLLVYQLGCDRPSGAGPKQDSAASWDGMNYCK